MKNLLLAAKFASFFLWCFCNDYKILRKFEKKWRKSKFFLQRPHLLIHWNRVHFSPYTHTHRVVVLFVSNRILKNLKPKWYKWYSPFLESRNYSIRVHIFFLQNVSKYFVFFSFDLSKVNGFYLDNVILTLIEIYSTKFGCISLIKIYSRKKKVDKSFRWTWVHIWNAFTEWQNAR